MGQVYPLPGGDLEYAAGSRAYKPWDGGHLSAAAAEADVSGVR